MCLRGMRTRIFDVSHHLQLPLTQASGLVGLQDALIKLLLTGAGLDISTRYNTEFPYTITGKARIVTALYAGLDPAETWKSLCDRLAANPNDAAAFYDISLILRTTGQADAAETTLTGALSISRQYRITNGNGTGMHVLVFVTGGDFMANTPIEFLLDGSDTVITLYHVDETLDDLDDAPEHDIAFLAIGHSDANMPVLERMKMLLENWEVPVVNGAAHQIQELSRDGVAVKFVGEPSILAPISTRVERERIAAVASGAADIRSLYDEACFPVIVRPLDTHAGNGMEKLSRPEDLASYLGRFADEAFYVCPFVDYSKHDGKFRKQRVAMIDGKPYASHLAVSEHWMVHYLSAGMMTYADRRAEEARWMADFDTDFAVRHAEAFKALHRHIGLDYFAIDCAELSDGRLLLFEADNAMIVHSMDSAETFPYKVEPMRHLAKSFEQALSKRIA